MDFYKPLFYIGIGTFLFICFIAYLCKDEDKCDLTNRGEIRGTGMHHNPLKICNGHSWMVYQPELGR